MPEDLIHRTSRRSWWSGRATALCGETAEWGQYETLWLLAWGPRCAECDRIAKDGDR